MGVVRNSARRIGWATTAVLVTLGFTAGVAVAKSSSHVCAWMDGLRRHVAGWESRDAKMDRVRYQIGKLDAKIKDSLGPIAEKMQEAACASSS